MNESETIALLRILREGWPEIKIDDDTIRFWMWAFGGVGYGQAERAAKRYIRTGKFAPKPADLLEFAAVEDVAPGMVPEEAWAEVRAEIRRVGFNRPPLFQGGRFVQVERSFSSPLIERAVEAVGWEYLCTGDNSKGFVKRDFVEALKAIIRQEVRQRQTGGEDAAPALPDGVVALGKGAAD